jgi:hypothetical protein
MTPRAALLTYVLCVCVRALTTDQAARLLGLADEANLRRLVRGLKAAGLLNAVTVWAKPVPDMTEPLVSYDPAAGCLLGKGLRATGLAQPTQWVPYVLNAAWARWAALPALPTPCLVATRKAGRLYGVRRDGAIRKHLQGSHDLAVSGCLLALLEAGRVRAEDWRGEDFVRFPLAGRTPDAVIVRRPSEEPHRVEEVVGADYTADKLLAVHRECQRRGLAYELW